MAARHTPPYQSYADDPRRVRGLLAGAAGSSRLLGRDPRSQTTLDFAVLSAATFKAARTLARDKVTSFIRQPFVEGEAYEGDEEPVANGGMQQAIGELVTCTRCVGTWAAAGLTSTQILAPRIGPDAHVVARRRRGERLPAGRLRRADERRRTSSTRRRADTTVRSPTDAATSIGRSCAASPSPR